jgi:hypothetical protein
MHRIFLAGVLILAGCQNIVGPFARRPPQRVDDPLLSIYEQEVRGRDRLALPLESPNVAPPAPARPGMTGFAQESAGH